jgi:hypothetical protein
MPSSDSMGNPGELYTSSQTNIFERDSPSSISLEVQVIIAKHQNGPEILFDGHSSDYNWT